MTSEPHAAPGAFVRWVLRHGRTLWIVALLLGVPATARTVFLYAHLRGEIEALLPTDAASVQALDELRARSPGLSFLSVVAEVGNADDLAGAERFLDDLSARISAYPPELVAHVRSSNAVEKRFLDAHAALYVDTEDLVEIRRRVERRRDYEVAKAAGQLLDEDEAPPSTDVSDIEKKYELRVSGQQGGHLSSVSLKAAMLFVEAGAFTTGGAKDRVLLSRVRADVSALDPKRYAPDLRVGYASDVAINVEELDALESDLSLSSVLVILAVVAVIILYYRWWRAIAVLIPPLLLATVYAFALASLPPMRVTELNSNTAFLGSIIVGNGINVGLILLARYREERRRGQSVEQALVVGVSQARVGTLAAAAAASAAYGSLILTEFRGFRQFGYIGGVGMLASWATAFVLIPPLVRWLDVEAPALDAGGSAAPSWLARGVERFSPALVVLVVALVVGSIVEVSRFDSSRLEYDMNKLRRVDTWVNGEGFWGRKSDAILGHYLTPTVILCDTIAQAREVEAAVRASMASGPLRPFVARVVGMDDVLPTRQLEKLEQVQRIRAALTPRIKASLSPEQRRKLDELFGVADMRVIRAEDLPATFTTGLRERDGSLGRSVLLYPRPSDALWKATAIHAFVATLRDLAATGSGGGMRPGRVAGGIPISGDLLDAIGHDAPIASGVSFLGVVAVVLGVLRSRWASLHVLASLVVGVLWLAGAAMALGIKLNFANFIAFPITFGIGVDYSVNVMTRYVQDGKNDIAGAIGSTGGAVALCSLTTIIGYSSLLLAKNRALFLFGVVAVLGEIACLTAAIVALPAWLVFARRFGKNQA